MVAKSKLFFLLLITLILHHHPIIINATTTEEWVVIKADLHTHNVSPDRLDAYHSDNYRLIGITDYELMLEKENLPYDIDNFDD